MLKIDHNCKASLCDMASIGVLYFREYPVTMVYKDTNDGTPVIKEWVDCDGGLERFFLYKVTTSHLEKFLRGLMSHQDLILSARQHPETGLADSFLFNEKNGEIVYSKPCHPLELKEDYLPDSDVYCNLKDCIDLDAIVSSFGLKLNHVPIIKSMTYEKLARTIVANLYKDKIEYGHPSIEHLETVCATVASDEDEIRAIALMHDIVEDFPESYNYASILREFNDRVALGVLFLTHAKYVTYAQYIDNIKKNHDAVLVKLADLRHNMDITRLKKLRDQDIERLRKYHAAYLELSKLNSTP